MEKIINYLEKPKDNGNGTVDFKESKLEEMIDNLKKDDKYQLINKVETVCIQFETMRVMPNNNLPTIARYQLAREIIKNKL